MAIFKTSVVPSKHTPKVILEVCVWEGGEGVYFDLLYKMGVHIMGCDTAGRKGQRGGGGEGVCGVKQSGA